MTHRNDGPFFYAGAELTVTNEDLALETEVQIAPMQGQLAERVPANTTPWPASWPN